ncbi:MAG: glycosyltransferase family 4 protein [Pseudomonadota bacterium]
MNSNLVLTGVAPIRAALHRAAATAWLEGARRLARLRVGQRSAARDFSRIAIVGALGRSNGIAQGALIQHAALARWGAEVELVDATRALRNPTARSTHRPATAYVFHCGGPQTASLIHAVLPHAARAWRVGYWAWELPDPPDDWEQFGDLVDEIWTPSSFAAESLAKLFDTPIKVVPHAVEPAGGRRMRGNAPFTVLVMADSRSSFARKNPHSAVQAFRAAFGDDPDARLIVKIGGGGNDARSLADAVMRLPNGSVIEEFLDAAEMTALYRASDVLLSLHRAEGFGLPMLEAMAQGVPVVATGWSGNMDFMSATDSVLVPHRLVQVEDSAGIYRASIWAEADVEAAAAALRHLAGDRNAYEEKSKAAFAAACRFYTTPIVEDIAA